METAAGNRRDSRDSSSGNDEQKDGAVRLKKELGLIEGIAVIIGIIVGSGIFVSPKGVLSKVGSTGVSLLVWASCGMLSMVGALCYAELGTTIVKSGGDYAYISEAFGPLPAFLFLWDANVIFVPTTNAIMALTFSQYLLQPFYPGCQLNSTAVKLLAAVAITGLTFINCYNMRITTRLQNMFMVTKMLPLVLIIIIGVIVFAQGDGHSFDNAFDNINESPSEISAAFYSGIYSYAGWNYLNFLTEELQNPYRNLPLAIYISLPVVAVVYVLTNVAYLVVLSPAEMLASDAIAVTVADRTLGSFSWVIPVFVTFSVLGALSAHIMTSSRLCFVGARNGQFPQFLSMINAKYFTPIPALITLCVLSLLYLTSDDIYSLIDYTSFVESSFNLVSVCSLLYLRYKQPDRHRPIKVSLVFPVLFLVVCSFLVLLPMYTRPYEVGMAVLLTLTGVPVYLACLHWRRRRSQQQLPSPPHLLQTLSEKFTIVSQKCFYTVKEE